MQFLIKFSNSETPLEYTRTVAIWDFSPRGGSKFSVNLQCGLRLLFAERHMRWRCREKRDRAQQGMLLFGTSQWVSITLCSLESRTGHGAPSSAWDCWHVPVVSTCQKLAPHEAAEARSLQFCFISYVWQAKWWFCLPLPRPGITVQAVLDNEAARTSLLQVSREITNSPLTPMKIIWKIDWIFFALGSVLLLSNAQLPSFLFFNFIFNIVFIIKNTFLLLCFSLGMFFVFTSNCMSRFPQGTSLGSLTSVQLYKLRLQVCSLLYFYLE